MKSKSVTERQRRLWTPWVKRPEQRVRRVLGFDPGQNWGSWAIVEDGSVVISGNHIIEHGSPGDVPQYLPRLDPTQLPQQERSHSRGLQFDRRLYGIREALIDLVEEKDPIDAVALYDYGQKRGQYAGIAKSVCFQQGLPIITVGWPEVGELLLGDLEAEFEQIEDEVQRRYPDIPIQPVTYDDGSVHQANPATSIGLALTAWHKLEEQGRT